MKKLLSISLFLLLLLITLTSCESNGSYSSKDIIGRWRMETYESGGEITPISVLIYWEFFSNGQLIIKEGSYEYTPKQWDIVDSKLIIGGSYSNYYLILKLTNSKLDLKYEGEDAPAIYHFVKANQ